MRTLSLMFLALFLIPVACAKGYSLGFTKEQESAFFRSLAHVESGNNRHKVGDVQLRHKAYGLYQIRQPYLNDVNTIAGKDVRRVWGVQSLTLQMVQNDQLKAQWAIRVYLHHYGARYTRITGRRPNAFIYSRIHNGGPNGWRIYDTLSYAREVHRWMIVHLNRS